MIWPQGRESRTGWPISSVMRADVSAPRRSISSASLNIHSARSAKVIFGHGPWSKASRAARTATSTSLADASGVRPTSLRS
jgi:hypothetical protein